MSLKIKDEEQKQNSESEIQHILSDFSQFYILLLLSEADSHGYGLIKKFKRRTGRALSAGTLYPFLQRLERNKLTLPRNDSVGKRQKTVYSLSKKGKAFCERLFQRFAAMTASAIEPGLEICASCGVKLFEGSHHEVIDGHTMSFCCPHCAAAFKRQRQDVHV